jgi:hypothetical protein
MLVVLGLIERMIIQRQRVMFDPELPRPLLQSAVFLEFGLRWRREHINQRIAVVVPRRYARPGAAQSIILIHHDQLHRV